MNNLILVRHGQSLWNKERRFTGWADVNLTDQGKKEAEYAAILIRKLNIEFDACFTSLQKRAINTLEIILNTLKIKNVKINKAFELMERNYGDLTGLNKDEMIKKHGNKQVHIWRRRRGVHLNGKVLKKICYFLDECWRTQSAVRGFAHTCPAGTF